MIKEMQQFEKMDVPVDGRDILLPCSGSRQSNQGLLENTARARFD